MTSTLSIQSDDRGVIRKRRRGKIYKDSQRIETKPSQKKLDFKQIFFLFSVFFSVISYGSVAPIPYSLSVILISISFLLTVSINQNEGAFFWTQRAKFILLPFIGMAIFQILPFPIETGFQHTSWKTAAEFFGSPVGTISADPSATLFALPTMICVLLSFVTALTLFQGNVERLRLLKILSSFGLLVALYSIVSFFIFPSLVIISKKIDHIDSLTATFLNRNTAATFFGLCSVVWLLKISSSFKNIGCCNYNGFLNIKIDFQKKEVRHAFSLMFSFLTILLALALTRSRAGIFFSFLSIVIVSVMLFMKKSTLVPKKGIFLVLTLTILIFFFLISGVAQRFEVQGFNDWRWCTYSSIFAKLFYDFDWLSLIIGNGGATFERIYPAMRKEECLIFGSWDFAHNVYLEVMTAFGLVGLCVVIYYIITIFEQLKIGTFEHLNFDFEEKISLVGLSFIALSHSAFDFSLQIFGLSVFFVVLFSCFINLRTN